MSRIDELIERLCPDGVSFVALEELCEKTTNIKWREAGAAEYSYIDLTSVDIRLRRIVDTSSVNAGNAPSRAQQIVQTGDVVFATTRPTQMRVCVIPQEYDGQICSTGFCVLRPSQCITTNYLMHALGTGDFCKYLEDNQTMGNYPAISNKKLLKYRIPVPPMEVQQEIVRVLDSFAKLEAELEVRRHQYVYYRDKLFDFAGRESVSWLKLGDFGTFTRGKRFTASDYVDMGIESIHYGEIYTRYGISATSTYSHLPESMRDSLRFAKNGDVIIAATGENVEDLCKSVAWLGDEEVAVHDDCWIISSDMNPRYIVHALLTSGVAVQKKRLVSNGKVSRISGKNLASISIPVPSLEEQERIVTILNKFDTLVNGISQGIPAEIAARRKQYAYYRDKLLSFEEKVV
ncbi:MAG: restriction endonuclease subunit S [Atopobiaceae bacterium]|nr:restriction endonuclease subunit S [Atopobiaceae bacterium]